MRKMCVYPTAALLCLLCLFSAGEAAALTGADVALYNDVSAPVSTQRGAWQSGVTAIKNMLTAMGYTYEEITYLDLQYAPEDFSTLYKVILVPGGYAPWYNYWISKAAKQRIRTFVAAGGGFFGICAGAYFASAEIVWEGTFYDDGVGWNYWGDWTGYDLNLYPGTGTGPINEIADWNTEHYNMTTINFTTGNSVLGSYRAVPFSEKILYYGGPRFTSFPAAPVEVLATYDFNGEPAIVAFPYSSGRVVLSGPHPEIEEDSAADGVTIDREDTMDDMGSDWPLTTHLLLWLMQESAGAVDLSLSSLSVLEGKPAGTNVGTFSTAGVGPGLATAYTLVSGPGDTDNGKFTIVGNALRTAAVFNQCAKSSYAIRVRSSVAQAHRLTEESFTITVSQDDVVRLSSATYAAGETGQSVTITATRAGGGTGAMGISYTTANGTATAGSDYTAAAGALGWADGDSASKTFTVPITNDAVDEPGETFTVSLFSPTGCAILGSPGSATVTIADNDPTPTVRFGLATSSRGEATPAAVLDVILSAPSSQHVTVYFATADGTAVAGSDYTATSGMVTFAPGDTSKSITVTIAGDAAVEPNETFTVTLSAPANATLGAISRHKVTIANDDPSGSIQLSSATYSFVEDGGTAVMITATRTGGSSGDVGISFATANGTATAGSDYTATSGKLVWLAGETGGRDIEVPIASNALDEPDETFSVRLSAPTGGAAMAAPSSGTVAITDDDAPPTVQFGSSTSSGAESTTPAVIEVSLSAPSARTVTVKYATANGPALGGAVSGSDYAARSGMLKFAPGVTSLKIAVPIANNTTIETPADETFTVTLSAPVNATLGTQREHTYTIQDEDRCGAIKLNSVKYSAGEPGLATITALRVGGSSGAASVTFNTSDLTATAGSDYTAVTGQALEWPDGDKVSRPVTIAILHDPLDEPNETIRVSLAPKALNCAVLGSPVEGTVTILDNDPPPKVLSSQAAADVPGRTAPADLPPDDEQAAIAAANDFDGDGRSDYGVFDASSGLWSLRLSTDGDVTVQLGSAGSIPITGDFDGDGMTDFGCYTPETGTWEIVLSSGGLRTETLGSAGAIPVVGDFDGDGTADIGCYYPAVPGEPGSWHIMQSSSGLIKVSFGGTGAIPIGGALR